MSDKKMTTGGNQAKNDKEFDFGLAIAIGLSFGLLFGTALGNAAMGITIGLLLAGLANAYHEKKQGKAVGSQPIVTIQVTEVVPATAE